MWGQGRSGLPFLSEDSPLVLFLNASLASCLSGLPKQRTSGLAAGPYGAVSVLKNKKPERDGPVTLRLNGGPEY